MKAVNYVRISEADPFKSEQERRKKLDDQLQVNDSFIKNKKWQCVDIYDEGYAKSTERNRPRFTQMRLDAINNKFDIIVVREQSRLARDPAFLIDFVKDMEALKIKIYESSTGRELVETELETNVKATIVDVEWIKKGKKYQASMMEIKQKEGNPFGNSPYGYDKDWKIIKEESAIVKKIFDLYIEHKRIMIVAKKVNMPPKKVWRILTNKRYTGIFLYERKFRGGDKTVLRTELIEYKANYTPIISEETFKKVEDILKR